MGVDAQPATPIAWRTSRALGAKLAEAAAADLGDQVKASVAPALYAELINQLRIQLGVTSEELLEHLDDDQL